MADAAVEFLLGNLQQLLRSHVNLIKGAKDQVEKLENCLRLLRTFLHDTTKKRRKDDSLRELVRQIRDVVYDAEDVIDAFVTQAAIVKSRNYLTRAFQKPVNLHGITEQVELITRKVKEVYGDKTLNNIVDEASAAQEEPGPAPMVRREKVVGLEDEAHQIMGYLRERTDELDVITITGMPGLGKTTLAWKIFHDEEIKYEFPTRIWVYVSQEFTKKDVYLTILKGFTSTITQEMKDKSDGELAQIVYEQLEKGKFLIVLDDLWSTEDWDKIKVVLPVRNNAGKVMITSRHLGVARHGSLQRRPHILRFLTAEESWLLLQYEVFGKPECPPELEIPGKIIVGQCDGLPMSIVLIAGILVNNTMAPDNINLMKNKWVKVSTSMGTYLNQDLAPSIKQIIASSYDRLPYHLRACFLYMGMFPEDYEIPVWKLILMWIAEGFIRQRDDASLEEIAEIYLLELINRNLVRTDKRRPDGSVKTCRIHSVIRYFCLSEAGSEKENFFQEINGTHEEFEHFSAVQKCRRICIHSNVMKFISLKPVGPRVRSFVCFSKEELTLPADRASAIPAAFKLLRVMDVKPIKITKIPSEMYHLVHLRYLILSFSLPVLPGAFDKLWNLETLIVDTSERTLEIKADIWKMSQLRHIKTYASATLPKVGKRIKEGEKLHTLGTISPQSCTKEVFDRARNLKKLGIRGNLTTLLHGETISFNNFAKLVGLQKLKLLNDVFPMPASEGRLQCLPPPYQFPPNLKSLTLSDTFLDWKHTSVLGLLEYLQVLKLKENAFVGHVWRADDGCFRKLEILHIGRTNLQLWAASQHHYPRLRCLQLHNCGELQEIPMGLADIPSFQMLEVYRSPNAGASAQKIYAIRREGQNMTDGEFKLSIFPPLI